MSVTAAVEKKRDVVDAMRLILARLPSPPPIDAPASTRLEYFRMWRRALRVDNVAKPLPETKQMLLLMEAEQRLPPLPDPPTFKALDRVICTRYVIARVTFAELVAAWEPADSNWLTTADIIALGTWLHSTVPLITGSLSADNDVAKAMVNSYAGVGVKLIKNRLDEFSSAQLSAIVYGRISESHPVAFLGTLEKELSLHEPVAINTAILRSVQVASADLSATAAAAAAPSSMEPASHVAAFRATKPPKHRAAVPKQPQQQTEQPQSPAVPAQQPPATAAAVPPKCAYCIRPPNDHATSACPRILAQRTRLAELEQAGHVLPTPVKPAPKKYSDAAALNTSLIVDLCSSLPPTHQTDIRPHCTISAGHALCTALIDSGAACCLIRQSHWDAMAAEHAFRAKPAAERLVRGLGTGAAFAPSAFITGLPIKFVRTQRATGSTTRSIQPHLSIDALVIPEQYWSERAGMILGADFLLGHKLHLISVASGHFELLWNDRPVADIFQGNSLANNTSCLLVESVTPALAAQFAAMVEDEALGEQSISSAAAAAAAVATSAGTPGTPAAANESTTTIKHCHISNQNIKDERVRDAVMHADLSEQAELPAPMSRADALRAAKQSVDKICETIIAAATDPRLVRSGWTPAHTRKYVDVWRRLGEAVCLPIEHVTHIAPDARKPPLPASFVIRLVDPYARKPTARCRTFAHDAEQWLQREIPRLVASGIIERCHSPTSSPLVIVRKRNGDFRLCIDLREINALTVPESSSTPNIQHLLQKMSGKMFYCGLDCLAAYWQVPIHDEQTRDLLAFSVAEQGQFRFVRMPFGCKTASAVAEKLFQQVWSSVPQQPQDVVSVSYADDHHTAANDPDHFIAAVEADLLALQQFDRPILLNAAKISPLAAVDNIFGFEVSADGTQLAPSQVEAIHRLRPPTTVRELQSIAGAVQWVSSYIPQLADITAPWRRALTGRDTASKAVLGADWSNECKLALDQVKQLIAQRIMLAPPKLDGTRTLHIFSDSSDDAISAVLCQEIGPTDTPINTSNPTPPQNLRPVAIFSKALNAVQRAWPIAHREAFAIVATLQKYEPWAHSASTVHCWTDSATAMGFFANPAATPDRNNKMFRWSLQLHQFQDLHFWHIAGEHNSFADVLSRLCTHSAQATDASVAAVAPLSLSAAPLTQSLDFIELSSVSDKLPATAALWLAAQQADTVLAPVLNFLSSGSLPTDPAVHKAVLNLADAVFIHPATGLLVRKPYERKQRLSTFTPHLRIVVPAQLHDTVLKLFHDDALNGFHRGQHETYERIAERLWWVGLHNSVINYVKICMHCAQVKPPKPPSHPRPNVVDPPTRPFEVVHIDYLYVTPSNRGNRYLLVLICALTGWIELWPCTTCDAASVLRCLRTDVFARHLCMPRFISDNGTHFTASALAQLLREINAKHSFCAAYSPQSNGKVERVNRTVLEMLRVYAHDWPQLWDEEDTLAPLLQQLRATISTSTGFAPYELVYARERQFPADEALRSIIEASVSNDNDLAAQHQRRLVAASEAYAKVRELLNATHKRLYKDGKNFTDLPKYKTNDTVWLYHPTTPSGEVSKTARYWRGPYLVSKHLGADSYLLSHYKNKDDQPKVNAARMIPTSALPEDFDKDDDFEVETYLEAKGVGRNRKVLVKWRYFPASHNSWISVPEAKRAPKAWAAFVRRGGGDVVK